LPALIFNGFYIILFHGFSLNKLKSIVIAVVSSVAITGSIKCAIYLRYETIESLQVLGIQAILIIAWCMLIYFFDKGHSHSDA